MLTPYHLHLTRRSLTNDGGSSSSPSVMPIALVVGAVCAVALIVGLLSVYAYTRRRNNNNNNHNNSSNINEKAMVSSPGMNTGVLRSNSNSSSLHPNDDINRQKLQNRTSVSIWHSVDLGRANLQNSMVLDGFEAAPLGYDPDAKAMTSFSLRYSEDDLMDNETDDMASERRRIRRPIDLDEGEVVEVEMPDEIEFYHQEPEPVHVHEDFTGVAHPLHHEEVPAGEQW